MANKIFFKPVSVVLGCVLAILLVEIGFRTAGGILSFGRDIRNQRNLSKEGVYRILCLGESTTQGQWPALLEEELNGQDRGVKFKVIDKGRSGTYSGAILARLEEYLDEFDPHMVVVMMGINDGEWVWRNPVAYEDKSSVKLLLLLKNMRVNKLARYLYEGLKERRPRDKKEVEDTNNDTTMSVTPENAWAYINEGDAHNRNKNYEKASELYSTAIKADPRNPHAYNGLGNVYFKIGDHEKAKRAFGEALKLDPKNSQAYRELGKLYFAIGEKSRGEAMYKAAIAADPKNAWACVELGNWYREKGEKGKAENLYRAGMKADPSNWYVYIELGTLYRERGETEKAREIYEAGIKADPHNPSMYIGLGNIYREAGEAEKEARIYDDGIRAGANNQWIYISLANFHRERGDDRKAEALYEDGIRADPHKPEAYIKLGDWYIEMGLHKKAELMFKACIKANPQDPRAYRELGEMYLKIGERKKAENVLASGFEAIGADPKLTGGLSLFYLQQGAAAVSDKHRRTSYPPIEMIRNYQNLRDQVLKRGAKLVCMQYPMRDAAALEKTLGTGKGILFVENRDNFTEALKTRKLSDLFIDMFAGDFGHCTTLGNRIIAQQLSATILQELFK